MHQGAKGRGERAPRVSQGTAGQLDEPGGRGPGDRRAVPGLHARQDHVRDTVQHGPVELSVLQDRRAAHRLAVRRVLDAHHDPGGHPSARQTRLARHRRLLCQGAALGRYARRRTRRTSAMALRSRPHHHSAQVSTTSIFIIIRYYCYYFFFPRIQPKFR